MLHVEKKTAEKDYSKFSLDSGFSAAITAEFRKGDYAREPKTTYINGWISAHQFMASISLRQIRDSRHISVPPLNNDKDTELQGFLTLSIVRILNN
jgi:hypothetical protein